MFQIKRGIHTGKDVLIVGGGPAGLSLATALKTSMSGLQVKLVEAQSLERLRNWRETVCGSGDTAAKPFENRVSSLTPRSVKFLTKIGAWNHIVDERVCPYDEMKVWDGISNAEIEFDPICLGEHDTIAYMVENANIQQALLARLRELGVESIVSDNTKVEHIKKVNSRPLVKLSTGQELSARLLVGADGQQSPVRKYAGIESRGWDYGRFGLVASLVLEYDNMRTAAYQRFLKTGPIAMLPMPDGNASLVWSTLPERAKWLQQLSPEAFCAMVNAGFRLEMVDIDYIHSLPPTATEEILGEINWRLEQSDVNLDDTHHNLPTPVAQVVDNSRAAFPLRMKHADTYVSDRIALVGDAAHATHPLAGQGLNMGQRDVEYLIDALEIATKRGMDIGSTLAIEPYWKNAYLQNHMKVGVVDKLHALYSTDFWPIVQARSLGLSTINNNEFIKRILMKMASN